MTTPNPFIELAVRRRFVPATCPHCEYDRRFPETENGGWVYMGNGMPIGPCGMCNPDGSHPRARAASESPHG